MVEIFNGTEPPDHGVLKMFLERNNDNKAGGVSLPLLPVKIKMKYAQVMTEINMGRTNC